MISRRLGTKHDQPFSAQMTNSVLLGPWPEYGTRRSLTAGNCLHEIPLTRVSSEFILPKRGHRTPKRLQHRVPHSPSLRGDPHSRGSTATGRGQVPCRPRGPSQKNGFSAVPLCKRSPSATCQGGHRWTVRRRGRAAFGSLEVLPRTGRGLRRPQGITMAALDMPVEHLAPQGSTSCHACLQSCSRQEIQCQKALGAPPPPPPPPVCPRAGVLNSHGFLNGKRGGSNTQPNSSSALATDQTPLTARACQLISALARGLPRVPDSTRVSSLQRGPQGWCREHLGWCDGSHGPWGSRRGSQGTGACGHSPSRVSSACRPHRKGSEGVPNLEHGHTAHPGCSPPRGRLQDWALTKA